MRVQPAVGPALDRAHGTTAGDDALGQDLPAEDPPVRLLLALAAEQRDVLGEGLRQRNRRLTVGPAAVDIGWTLICAEPELLEVERGEEVEEGCRLVGGHRGNDSQATRGRPSGRRPERRPRLVAPWPLELRTVSTARVSRSTASVIVSGAST